LRSPLIFRLFKDGQLVGVKQYDQDQIVVGKGSDVHLSLESEAVSPIHCLIERREGGYYICDLGSATGTFKNGQAVLDEAISSGDEVDIGPFKISFFVGVPKPKTAPEGTAVVGSIPAAAVVTETVVTMPPQAATPPSAPVEMVIPEPEPVNPVEESMPPAAVVKTEEVVVTAVIPPTIPMVAPVEEEKPAIVAVPVKPEIRGKHDPFKKAKKSKTFAPPSEIKDLRTHLKPGKGNVLQVLVTWKERILTTYHYRGNAVVRVGADEQGQIALPDGLVPKGFPLVEMAGTAKVQLTNDMTAELISPNGNQTLEDMQKNGKATRVGVGQSIRLDQGEMLCLTLPGGNLSIYVRYTPQSPVVPMLPPLMLSSSELAGLVMSMVMVGLLALYVSATTPKDSEEPKQEDLQRMAQIIFDRKPVPPPPKPPEPEPEVEKTPPPPPPAPKKVVVADQNKEAQKKGAVNAKSQPAQTAGRAAEVAPKETTNKVKKFTSTRQGGAVKTGQTAGANAASANKDVSKVGLFSAFGGGGNRANIDKAYSGAGEVLGMADKATGTSGFNEDRAGDDLGSKFKDSGAGGKGTATQGIAGVGTKGRGSGQSAYGAANGYGSKNSVAIEGGGFEESFDATIDKEAIRRVIRAKKHELQSCYERALNTMSKGHRLDGKIVLAWEIIEKGQARNVRVASSTLGNPTLENCIRDRLASWTFPEPPAGMTAEVKAYPFVLNQSN
jgi:pSer/pThr/pTyr-binding forkhead associated (FHA) protein/outer membrane biosynthesis protein TonB